MSRLLMLMSWETSSPLSEVTELGDLYLHTEEWKTILLVVNKRKTKNERKKIKGRFKKSVII